jgi:hypothetical protein
VIEIAVIVLVIAVIANAAVSQWQLKVITNALLRDAGIETHIGEPAPHMPQESWRNNVL